MKDWERIRKARNDLTDYVIHWTNYKHTESKGTITPYEVLQEILQCGYLKPSFAPRTSYFTGATDNTIKGDYPAVCLTEQPLDCFIMSCNSLPIKYEKNRSIVCRYTPYGIILNKRYLYDYGGRPVIYGDKILLEGLPKEYKYLWVRYDPIPAPGPFVSDVYPIDWTHEREWRCRVNQSYPRYLRKENLPLPQEGVPILLPMDYRENKITPDFYILVDKKEEITDLKQWILHQLPYEGKNKYLCVYFERLPNAQIISLQEVKEHLQTGEQEWARVDTLPKPNYNVTNDEYSFHYQYTKLCLII